VTRPPERSTDEFVGRLFTASLQAGEIATVYIGDRLGLYQALSDLGSATPAELARHLSLNERYVREWLEQQTAADILQVEDTSGDAGSRRYSLPREYAEALIDPDNPNSIAPLARFFIGTFLALPKILEAFRTGKGVSWADYGQDVIESQGDFNRPWLVHQFGTEFLPAIPEIHARLQASPPARVLDVACGVGWASIAIARAYPNVVIEAIDLDAGSIELARAAARDAGVVNRIDFSAEDASALATRTPYDLAVIVESVHDMSQPVEVLASVRRVLAPGGSLLVADERVADAFSAPGDEVERIMYAFSVLCCLPAGMADEPSAATGTVMRASTLERYAREAGFERFEVLPIEHPLLRFYRLQ
jgi:2-polyprenyl-3-methyl-5-hydroxy-6-metoxy-1,4-benzoquinol methylase